MLSLALLIILFFLAFLAFGFSKQFIGNKKLKSEFHNFGAQKLILTDSCVNLDHLAHQENISIIEVAPAVLLNAKSFSRRIMKKTGIQMLPIEVWMSDHGDLKGKAIK